MVYARWYFRDESGQEQGPWDSEELAKEAEWLYAVTLRRELTPQEETRLRELFFLAKNDAVPSVGRWQPGWDERDVDDICERRSVGRGRTISYEYKQSVSGFARPRIRWDAGMG